MDQRPRQQMRDGKIPWERLRSLGLDDDLITSGGVQGPVLLDNSRCGIDALELV